jgi:branched-chain amino acid transport system permease protein
MIRRLIPLFALLLLAGLAPVLLPTFHVTLLNYIGLYSLVALGLVLLTGIGGMTSFGQAAFVGIGAYASAVLTTQYGLSPWLGLLAGLAITFVVATSLGLLTLRLAGHYLPIGTLAWGLALFYLFGNLPGLGGFGGLQNLPNISLFGWQVRDPGRLQPADWAAVGDQPVAARQPAAQPPGPRHPHPQGFRRHG